MEPPLSDSPLEAAEEATCAHWARFKGHTKSQSNFRDLLTSQSSVGSGWGGWWGCASARLLLNEAERLQMESLPDLDLRSQTGQIKRQEERVLWGAHSPATLASGSVSAPNLCGVVRRTSPSSTACICSALFQSQHVHTFHLYQKKHVTLCAPPPKPFNIAFNCFSPFYLNCWYARGRKCVCYHSWCDPPTRHPPSPLTHSYKGTGRRTCYYGRARLYYACWMCWRRTGMYTAEPHKNLL